MNFHEIANCTVNSGNQFLEAVAGVEPAWTRFAGERLTVHPHRQGAVNADRGESACRRVSSVEDVPMPRSARRGS